MQGCSSISLRLGYSKEWRFIVSPNYYTNFSLQTKFFQLLFRDFIFSGQIVFYGIHIFLCADKIILYIAYYVLTIHRRLVEKKKHVRNVPKLYKRAFYRAGRPLHPYIKNNRPQRNSLFWKMRYGNRGFKNKKVQFLRSTLWGFETRSQPIFDFLYINWNYYTRSSNYYFFQPCLTNFLVKDIINLRILSKLNNYGLFYIFPARKLVESCTGIIYVLKYRPSKLVIKERRKEKIYFLKPLNDSRILRFSKHPKQWVYETEYKDQKRINFVEPWFFLDKFYSFVFPIQFVRPNRVSRLSSASSVFLGVSLKFFVNSIMDRFLLVYKTFIQYISSGGNDFDERNLIVLRSLNRLYIYLRYIIRKQSLNVWPRSCSRHFFINGVVKEDDLFVKNMESVKELNSGKERSLLKFFFSKWNFNEFQKLNIPTIQNLLRRENRRWQISRKDITKEGFKGSTFIISINNAVSFGSSNDLISVYSNFELNYWLEQLPPKLVNLRRNHVSRGVLESVGGHKKFTQRGLSFVKKGVVKDKLFYSQILHSYIKYVCYRGTVNIFLNITVYGSLQRPVVTFAQTFFFSLMAGINNSSNRFHKRQVVVKLNNRFKRISARNRLWVIDRIHIISFVCLFTRGNVELLGSSLCHFLSRTRYHRMVLRDFIMVFNKLREIEIVSIRGFRLAVNGPIGKHARTKRFRYSNGQIRRASFFLPVDSGVWHANTFYGTLGVRLWLLR